MSKKMLTQFEKRAIDDALRADKNPEAYALFHRTLERYSKRDDGVIDEDGAWVRTAKQYGFLPDYTSSGRRKKKKAAQKRAKQLPAAASIKEPIANSESTDPIAEIESPPPVPSENTPEPRKGQVSLRERIEWVFEHLELPNVTADQAPTPGTWAMFSVYNAGAGTRQAFYEKFVTPLLPNKAALALDAQRYDTGEVPLGFIAQCQRMGTKVKEIHPEFATPQN